MRTKTVTVENSFENDKLKFQLSSGNPDRDRDVINQDGWDLENYRKNPVVLWSHKSWDLPIAKSTVAIENGVLMGEAEFVPKDVYPFADTVKQLYKGGFLKATSVGFRALSYFYNEARGGYDIQKQELYEWSAVPVPANPDALLQAKSAGIDMSPMQEWFEKDTEAFGKTVEAFNKLKGYSSSDTSQELAELKKELSELKAAHSKDIVDLAEIKMALLRLSLR